VGEENGGEGGHKCFSLEVSSSPWRWWFEDRIVGGWLAASEDMHRQAEQTGGNEMRATKSYAASPQRGKYETANYFNRLFIFG
jgi:hypothetical protein